RLEMARPARVVVEILGRDHQRLAATCAINSSSDLARRGGVTGLAAALTGAAFAGSGLRGGFSAAAAPTGGAGTGASGATTGASGAAAATGAAGSDSAVSPADSRAVGGSTGDGVWGRSGMSVKLARSCFVAIGPSDR